MNGAMVRQEQTLASKIAAASIRVGALEADKTNTQQNYKYISADKILERAGNALAAEGILVLPSIVHEETSEVTYTDGYGKTKTRYDAVVTFNMLITDGEKELVAPWAGRGNDYAVPDKAMYKAITSGHKYFLAKLLNVGVGNEDGEHESEPEPSRQPAKAPNPRGAANHVNGNGHDPVVDTLVGKPVASVAQIRLLNEVGMEYYRDRWDMSIQKWLDWASDAKASMPGELSPEQADAIIEAIRNRIAAAVQKESA